MELVVSRDNKELTIKIIGRLNTSSSPELESLLNKELPNANKLIFDLSKLEYISSAGIRIFIGALKIMKKQGEALFLNPNAEVSSVFEMTGFDSIANIQNIDSKDAVESEISADFILESRLLKLNPDLHARYKSSIFAFQKILESYQGLFPSFTDHSILHSIDVVRFCSKLIGNNIEKLNAESLYILLMACYLHDFGMGISIKDYYEACDFLGYEQVALSDISKQIRKYHNEFSGYLIKKFAFLFDIPNENLVYGIVQVSRGHRKTDLYDEKEYEKEFDCGNGAKACLPYLSALIRLADEVDVASDRNISFLFDGMVMTTENDIISHNTHKAIKHLSIKDDHFLMYLDNSNQEITKLVLDQNVKIQETIDYCVDVVAKRTDFKITQTRIEIKEV